MRLSSFTPKTTFLAVSYFCQCHTIFHHLSSDPNELLSVGYKKTRKLRSGLSPSSIFHIQSVTSTARVSNTYCLSWFF